MIHIITDMFLIISVCRSCYNITLNDLTTYLLSRRRSIFQVLIQYSLIIYCKKMSERFYTEKNRKFKMSNLLIVFKNNIQCNSKCHASRVVFYAAINK